MYLVDIFLKSLNDVYFHSTDNKLHLFIVKIKMHNVQNTVIVTTIELYSRRNN